MEVDDSGEVKLYRILNIYIIYIYHRKRNLLSCAAFEIKSQKIHKLIIVTF